MVGTDINYQYIDWAHPKIIDEMDEVEDMQEFAKHKSSVFQSKLMLEKKKFEKRVKKVRDNCGFSGRRIWKSAQHLFN